MGLPIAQYTQRWQLISEPGDARVQGRCAADVKHLQCTKFHACHLCRHAIHTFRLRAFWLDLEIRHSKEEQIATLSDITAVCYFQALDVVISFAQSTQYLIIARSVVQTQYTKRVE